MKTLRVLAALAALAAPALAQDHAMPVDLPAICLANAPATDAGSMGMSMSMGDMSMGDMSMGGMGMATEGDAAHAELMGGMNRMNADMMAGGTASDIDVAFICAMIPHHRGAIDMAKAELAHGDDPFARGLAEAVIAAQEKEIADMLAWLAEQK